MFIQPWDAALDRAEWQQWLAGTDRFGVLAVINLDPAQAPLVVPTPVSPYRRAKEGEHPEHGVPTSYYSAVQFLCRPEVVDDPEEKAAILRAQLGAFQPEGGHAPMSVDSAPYGRMLSGIRGLRLEVLGVDAKFKYDDPQPVEHRQRVSDQLVERGRGLDHDAATQQRRRLDTVGEWQARS